jgi:hypothetical protein
LLSKHAAADCHRRRHFACPQLFAGGDVLTSDHGVSNILHYTDAACNFLFFGQRILKECSLKLIGCLLLVSGFFVALAALVLMNSFATKLGFVAAGIGVEALGLGLLINGHRPVSKEQR